MKKKEEKNRLITTWVAISRVDRHWIHPRQFSPSVLIWTPSFKWRRLIISWHLCIYHVHTYWASRVAIESLRVSYVPSPIFTGGATRWTRWHHRSAFDHRFHNWNWSRFVWSWIGCQWHRRCSSVCLAFAIGGDQRCCDPGDIMGVGLKVIYVSLLCIFPLSLLKTQVFCLPTIFKKIGHKLWRIMAYVNFVFG